MCIDTKPIEFEYFLQSHRSYDSTKRLCIEVKTKTNGKIDANYVGYKNGVENLHANQKQQL